MSKYTVCYGMGVAPQGMQEFIKEVRADEYAINEDGSLVFTSKNELGRQQLIACFKQYHWCVDESQIPVVAAPISRIGRQ